MYLPTPTYKFPPGLRGVVEQDIAPKQRGRVKFKASYWPAELVDEVDMITLQINDNVQVVGRRGIVLLVEPATKI